MLYKYIPFLLLFAFIFVLISYLYEILSTIWNQVSRDPVTATQQSFTLPLSNASNLSLNQLKFLLQLRTIYQLKQRESNHDGDEHFTVDEKEHEKETLVQLVESSGRISNNEVLALESETISDSILSNEKGSNICDNISQQHYSKLFTSARLLDEEVFNESNDSNDGQTPRLWLLYIVDHQEHGIDAEPNQCVWQSVISQFARYDVSFAQFDCTTDYVYCYKKQWFHSQIVLLIPTQSKFTVMGRPKLSKLMKSFTIGSETKPDKVIDWVNKEMKNQLVVLDETVNVHSWLQSKGDQEDDLVKMVAIMDRRFRYFPPLTFAFLAARFRGRAQFGLHFTSESNLAHYYHVQMPTVLVRYQSKQVALLRHQHNEPLTYRELDLYLRGIRPEMNDFYLVLLSAMNLALTLNYFWTRCMTIGKHLWLCTAKVVEWNLIFTVVVLVWPFILEYFTPMISFLPALLCNSIFSMAIDCWLTLWSSSFAFDMRTRLLLTSFFFERFCAAFLICGFILVTIRRARMGSQSTYDDELLQTLFYWIFSIGCLLGFVLFRKTRHHRSSTGIRRRLYGAAGSRGDLRETIGADNRNVNNLTGSSQIEVSSLEDEDDGDYSEVENNNSDDFVNYIDVDEDFDRMLIDSLFTMPNLWLQPELISSDYIHQLPVWQHHCLNFDSNQNPLGFESDVEHLLDNNQQEYFSANSNGSSDSGDGSDSETPGNVALFTNQQCETSNSISNRPEFQYIDREDNSQLTTTKMVSKISTILTSTTTDDLVKCSSSKVALAEISSSSTASHQQLFKKFEAKQKLIRMQRRKKRKRANTVSATDSTLIINDQPKQFSSSIANNNDKPKWMLDFNDCTICLDAYLESQSICGLPCGHNYHQYCISQWLVRGNHRCPICRWPSYRLKHPRQQVGAQNSNNIVPQSVCC